METEVAVRGQNNAVRTSAAVGVGAWPSVCMKDVAKVFKLEVCV